MGVKIAFETLQAVVVDEQKQADLQHARKVNDDLGAKLEETERTSAQLSSLQI